MRLDNHNGNVEIDASALLAPTSPAGLARAVREVRERGGSARALGSRLSYSGVIETDGRVILPNGLTRVRSVPRERLCLPECADELVEIEAGVRLGQLQSSLLRTGRSLRHLPGLLRQTFVGAASTGTHGSGLDFGLLSDEIVSVLLVAGTGEVMRIEPEDGPSAEEGPYPLVRDDGLFRSVILGLGALGVVHSCWVRVRPRLKLHERRYLADVEQALAKLADPEWTGGHRHVEVLLLPGDDFSCLVSERDEVPFETPDRGWYKRLQRDLVSPRSVSQLAPPVGNRVPGFFNQAMQRALRILAVEGHVAEMSTVMNLDAAARFKSSSIELAVPLGAGVAALKRIVEALERPRPPFACSIPVGVRVVGASQALLAPSWDGPVCTIEWPNLAGVRGAYALHSWFEELLSDFGPRPHWGQLHQIPERPDHVDRLYAGAATFRRAVRTLDPDSLFANAFTYAWGLSDRPRRNPRGQQESSRMSIDEGAVSDRIQSELPSRGLEPEDTSGFIPEKRDVHRFMVSAPASRFARCFAELLRDPEARFGTVRVKRLRERVGEPFEAGERFQGGFDLGLTVQRATASWHDGLRWPIGRALRSRRVKALLGRVEELACSDFAEVESIEVEPCDGEERWRLSYRYLEGTPITGHTEYHVDPAGESRCVVTQVFTYREINAAAWLTFQAIGLRLHNAAVYAQVLGAATRAGGRIESSTLSP